MSAHPEVEISCDGPELLVGQFPCDTPPIFGKTAIEARRSARAAGWRVSIFRHGSSRRGDQCPDCRVNAGAS